MRKKLEVIGITNSKQKASLTMKQPCASTHSVYGVNNSTQKKMSKSYEIKFAPIDPLSYSYVVEANNEGDALREAEENFQFDIGYDRAKDFEVSNIICSDDE